MLVVLIGGTLKVARDSRQYFISKGFDVVEKQIHSPMDRPSVMPSYLPQNKTKEEIEQCDYVYSAGQGKIGFTLEQIIDAVRGRCNVLLTVLPEDLDFVRQIKASFGDCLRLVYLHIDRASTEEMISRYIPFITEYEVQERLCVSDKCKELFAKEMALFDKVVVYEENSILGLEVLYQQYDSIIQELQHMNDKLFVELPYKGFDNYIFVSYSHRDENVVIPILSKLQKEGYRIWYDEGIHGGTNWRIMIGERLEGCTDFLLFSSKNSTQSKNVFAEIGVALDMPEPHPIVVRLDDATFPKGYEMYLKEYQNISVDNDSLIERLKEALSPSTRV